MIGKEASSSSSENEQKNQGASNLVANFVRSTILGLMVLALASYLVLGKGLEFWTALIGFVIFSMDFLLIIYSCRKVTMVVQEIGRKQRVTLGKGALVVFGLGKLTIMLLIIYYLMVQLRLPEWPFAIGSLTALFVLMVACFNNWISKTRLSP